MIYWLLERMAGMDDFQRCPDLDMLLALYGLQSYLIDILPGNIGEKN